MHGSVFAASHLARFGVPVFPCDTSKRPLVATGFKAATRGPATVADWWARWPDALIGVSTGAASGLHVMDLDVDRATGEAKGEASLCAAGYDPAQHRHAGTTQSGGLHQLFRATGLRTTAGALTGVDVRGKGGYVTAWETRAILDAIRDPADPPPALVETLRRRGKPETQDGGFSFDPGPRPADDADRWAAVPLARETAAVRAAPEGQRDMRRALESEISMVGGRA